MGSEMCIRDRKSTARDLDEIRKYMRKGDDFQQVCDLQGFFLKKEGFKVSDVPEILNICIKPNYNVNFINLVSQVKGDLWGG